MAHEYRVTRKLQEQSGSFFVTLPKLWVDAEGLKESDALDVVFNGEVKVSPPGREDRAVRISRSQHR